MPALADDWPQLRGPNFDGTSNEANLFESWPDEGPPLLWTVSLGQGYSAVSVANDLAYTMYQDAIGQYVLCLNANTGDTAWKHRVGLPYETMGIYPGPRATPCIVEGRVYYTTPDSLLGCLSATTGEPLWEVDFGTKFQGVGTEFGYSASPLVLDDKVIIPVGGQNAAVVAFSAFNGEVVWTTGNQAASYCTTQPIDLDGQTLLVNYLQNYVTICDAETGKELYAKRISNGYDEHAAAPIWVEPVLVLSAPFRAGAEAFTLSIDDSSETLMLNVESRWQSTEMSNDTASSLAIDNTFFGFDLRDQQAKAHRPSRGTFRCLDIETGQTLWSTKDVGHATAAAVDGKLFLWTDDGQLMLAAADRAEYRPLARTRVFSDEIIWTPPTLSNGRLFLRSPSRIACLQVGKLAPSSMRAQPSQTTADIPQLSKFSFDWLIRGEREHPFMIAPSEDVARWFAATLFVAFLPAALISLAYQQVTRWRGSRRVAATRDPQQCTAHSVQASTLFIAVLFTCGLASTAVLNEYDDGFWFTLPVCPFAALLYACLASERFRTAPSKSTKRHSWLAGTLLILTAAGYFKILHDQSLPHEWVYLVGLVLAFPLAVLSARTIVAQRSLFLVTSLVSLAWTVFFWTGPLFQRLPRL